MEAKQDTRGFSDREMLKLSRNGFEEFGQICTDKSSSLALPFKISGTTLQTLLSVLAIAVDVTVILKMVEILRQ